jgi:hypothetical protein
MGSNNLQTLGNEFLDAQTGKMGDGWIYTYTAEEN